MDKILNFLASDIKVFFSHSRFIFFIWNIYCSNDRNQLNQVWVKETKPHFGLVILLSNIPFLLERSPEFLRSWICKNVIQCCS
ncbi:unnamed protein product [Blepharisma stoltei]|uniref:Maturase K n=1 Tax=Blepharisma stoltei TaxID=1481888 RepID=A0AAU9K9U7_9CILI|nr:unnamed protein product [Blepharisma stoltei]